MICLNSALRLEHNWASFPGTSLVETLCDLRDSASHCHRTAENCYHMEEHAGTEETAGADCILHLLSSAFLSKLFRHPEAWTLSNSYKEHAFRWFNNIPGMYDSNTALFLFNYKLISSSHHLQSVLCIS